MRQTLKFLALVASITSASAAATQGFNYGATGPDGVRDQASFEQAFATAKALAGTNGAFSSARLYTMIQGDTTSNVTSAIPAAIKQGTTLLLGLWASGSNMDNEITALKAAIETYGTDFTDLVEGISVGSEDLYRNSYTGMTSPNAAIGEDPKVLVEYIENVRKAIAGTSLSEAKVGHVDTWDAYTNSSNAEVIKNCDFLGFDTYPYWQTKDNNPIENAKTLWIEAYNKVLAVADGTPIWVTETGWAVNDDEETRGLAVPGTKNSKTFWDEVGCGMLFGNTKTWWYTLSETGASPDFGVSDSESNTTPLYNLSCEGITAVPISETKLSGSGNSNNSTSGSNNSTSGSGSNSSVSTGSNSPTSTGSGSSGSPTGPSSSTGSDTSAARANLVSACALVGAGLFALMAAL